MRKIINPCRCKGYTNAGKPGMYETYCEIEYNEEKGSLSITGVIGPRSSGNCAGSAGQCQNEIRKGEVNSGWTPEMLQKFCDIWDTWHLNDMKPYCSHMKELGWDKEAKEKVLVRTAQLTTKTIIAQNRAFDRAEQYLKQGRTFIPTKEETMLANLPHSIKIYNNKFSEELQKFYELNSRTSYDEDVLRGWINCEDNPIGLLCKPCPVCGYKYGTSWLKEDVPEDVIRWLGNLPDTKKTPAWV